MKLTAIRPKEVRGKSELVTYDELNWKFDDHELSRVISVKIIDEPEALLRVEIVAYVTESEGFK